MPSPARATAPTSSGAVPVAPTMAYNYRVRKPKITLKLRAAVILTPSEKIPKIRKNPDRNIVAIETGNRNGKLHSKNKALAQKLPPCNIPFNSPTVASKAQLYADHPIKWWHDLCLSIDMVTKCSENHQISTSR